MYVRPENHTVEGPSRLARILGDEDPDPLARNVRIQETGCPDGLVRKPHGNFCGLGHGPEIMGRNAEFITRKRKIQEGAHLAIGLVRNLRPGIIIKGCDPTAKAEPG